MVARARPRSGTDRCRHGDPGPSDRVGRFSGAGDAVGAGEEPQQRRAVRGVQDAGADEVFDAEDRLGRAVLRGRYRASAIAAGSAAGTSGRETSAGGRSTVEVPSVGSMPGLSRKKIRDVSSAYVGGCVVVRRRCEPSAAVHVEVSTWNIMLANFPFFICTVPPLVPEVRRYSKAPCTPS